MGTRRFEWLDAFPLPRYGVGLRSFCGWFSGLELLPCGIDVLLWSVRRKLDGFHWLELGSNGALVSSNLANVHLGPPITPACTLFLAGANPSTTYVNAKYAGFQSEKLCQMLFSVWVP